MKRSRMSVLSIVCLCLMMLSVSIARAQPAPPPPGTFGPVADPGAGAPASPDPAASVPATPDSSVTVPPALTPEQQARRQAKAEQQKRIASAKRQGMLGAVIVERIPDIELEVDWAGNAKAMQPQTDQLLQALARIPPPPPPTPWYQEPVYLVTAGLVATGLVCVAVTGNPLCAVFVFE